MTDAELIARLRSDHPDHLTSAAADRIEALSISNATLIAERDKQAGYKEDYRAGYGEACLQLQETEAKLAECEARLGKAVEALLVVDALDPESLVGGCSRDALSGLVNRMGDKARATLAEIKGENHE